MISYPAATTVPSVGRSLLCVGLKYWNITVMKKCKSCKGNIDIL